MKHSESIAALAGALAKAQLQIEPASKNATNPHFRSHYADLASIWDACRGPLNTNGLSIVQFPCDGDVGRTGLCTMLLHSSGEYISEVVTTRSQKDDPQGLGSALTYLRRYALAAVVGVTATEDDDGNAASTPANSRVSAPAPRPYIPPPVSPPAVNAPAPSKPVSQPVSQPVAKPVQTANNVIDKVALQMTPDKNSVQAIVEFYKVDEGMGKNNKPYTKHRIGWLDSNGKMIYGTTFSASDGDCACESMDLKCPCEITYVVGQYGLDIKSVKMSTLPTSATEYAGGDDEIPF
ncbi:Essential recombination function protein [uncultured Caudovirales phage]|uniref:Essential recombination function protein n=1 Tax=uncultured Caudovirales phage TaxID=2100421 RepID=A0A6J5MXV6_9CAUD|nr:Essential recombination function protein [uncultured Caudovirales phage]